VAFGWRRKQLQKILRSAPEYRLTPEEVAEVAVAVGFDARTRPETLDPATFLSLSRALDRVGRERGGDPSC
jgi:16S rRNA A1518/A1519 N6-dimethyltransferase RsmA/KsgA/DIM1 with predicted DNA glycosylase/AP lyase activity